MDGEYTCTGWWWIVIERVFTLVLIEKAFTIIFIENIVTIVNFTTIFTNNIIVILTIVFENAVTLFIEDIF